MTDTPETPDVSEKPKEKREPFTFIIPTRPQPGEVLRYTLRSIWAHHPDATVWLAGSFPGWVDSDRVGHIQTDETGGKFGGIHAAFTAVLAHPEVAPEWVRCDDDTVLFAPLPRGFPAYARVQRIGEFVDALKEADPKRYPDHNAYVQGMQSQRRILNSWGYGDESPCFDSHTPMRFRSETLSAVFGRLEAEHPDHPPGHFRSIYGNVSGDAWVELTDPKLLRPQQRFSDDQLFGSTWRPSWGGRPGKQIRERYSDLTPFERLGPVEASRYRHRAGKYSRPVETNSR